MGRGKTYRREVESELSLEETYKACHLACGPQKLKVRDQQRTADSFAIQAEQPMFHSVIDWPSAVEVEGHVGPSGVTVTVLAFRRRGHMLAPDDCAEKVLDGYVSTLEAPLHPQAARRDLEASAARGETAPVRTLREHEAMLLAQNLETDETVKVALHGIGDDVVIGTDRRLFSFHKGQGLGWPYREVSDLAVKNEPLGARCLEFTAPVPLEHVIWAPGKVQLDTKRAWENDWARLQIAWEQGASTSAGSVRSDTRERIALTGGVVAAEGFHLLSPGNPCRLEFDADEVVAYTLRDTGYGSAKSVRLADVTTLRVGGPGVVSANLGQGWLDGGVGGEEGIPDSLLTAALSTFTSRQSLGFETILHLGAKGMELLLLAYEHPAAIQERLGPVMGRLGVGGDALPDHKAGAGTGTTRLEQLKLLGELRASGVLTEDEFRAEKARILEDDDVPG